MKRFLRFAIAQINVTVGDLDGNVERIHTALKAARVQGADLTVFPELTVTGYPPEDLLFKKHFIDANLRALGRVARLTRGTNAVVGFVNRRGSRVYNAAAVFTDGRLAGVYHKICLPNYGVFDEKRYFSAGEDLLFLKSRYGLIGVSICEDLWPADSRFLKEIRRRSLHTLINLSASPYHYRKHRERFNLFRARARQLKTHLMHVNLVGGQDELVFDGCSYAFDARGKLLCRAPLFGEGLFFYDVPAVPRRVPRVRGGFPARVRNIRLKGRAFPDHPAPDTAAPPVSRNPVEEIYQALCLGTHDYVTKNRFKKVLVGLSGGIDSAVVAAVAADAIGPANVIGVTMPTSFSSAATRQDARILAKNLGIRLITLPIEDLRQAYLRSLKAVFKGSRPDVTEENLQARIRGTLLMALSNKWGYLVLTTGNKSELAMGYCTLYGDMAGGFAVIQDVPKTIVYRLAHYRNTVAGNPVIPRSLIRRAPTAELRHGQKDTDSLPAYPRLDPILEAYVENNFSPRLIRSRKVPARLVTEIIRKVDLAEYKRRQGPPGIKITPRAFGRDRRMPITNRFNDELTPRR